LLFALSSVPLPGLTGKAAGRTFAFVNRSRPVRRGGYEEDPMEIDQGGFRPASGSPGRAFHPRWAV